MRLPARERLQNRKPRRYQAEPALADRRGPRLLTVTGMTIVAIMLIALAFGRPGQLTLITGLAAVGAGLGLFTPPNNAAIMAAAPKRQSGMAGGVLNMTRGTGTALGLSLTGAAYELGTSPWQGFRIAVLFLASMSAAAALLASRRGHRPGETGTARKDPSPGGAEELPGYDKLIAGAGTVPARRPDHWLTGPTLLAPGMGCTFRTRWATRSRSCAPRVLHPAPRRPLGSGPDQRPSLSPADQAELTRLTSARNPRSRPAAAYASTASGRGHTMATGDTASDPLLAAGATRAFPTPGMCRQRLRRPAPRRPAAPGRAARCVRPRAAREAPFRSKRRSANGGDAEVDA